MGSILEIFASGQIQHTPAIPRHSYIAFIAVIADARLATRVFTTNLLGFVMGIIVTNNDSEIGKRLGQETVERLADELLPVVNGDADAHERSARCRSVAQDILSSIAFADRTGVPLISGSVIGRKHENSPLPQEHCPNFRDDSKHHCTLRPTWSAA